MPRVTTPLYELLSMQRGEIGTGGVKMAPQNVKRPHPVILIASKSHQNALEKVLVDPNIECKDLFLLFSASFTASSKIHGYVTHTS